MNNVSQGSKRSNAINQTAVHTEYNKTDDFRVSINMEIKCNNDINWNL